MLYEGFTVCLRFLMFAVGTSGQSFGAQVELDVPRVLHERCINTSIFKDKQVATAPAITIDTIELDGDHSLWEVMRAALQAKEAQPKAPLLPGLLIFKLNEVIARVYESGDESRTLLVRTAAGIHKIYLNCHDSLLMLYRTSVMTLQKMEGTAVIFLGERTEKDAGHVTVYAMKWTARQFLQSPSRDGHFPATNDSIFQPFFLDKEEICWAAEVTRASLGKPITNSTLASLVTAGFEADDSSREPVTEEQIRKNLAKFRKNSPCWRNKIDPRFSSFLEQATK